MISQEMARKFVFSDIIKHQRVEVAFVYNQDISFVAWKGLKDFCLEMGCFIPF
jgi:hypothetical protein